MAFFKFPWLGRATPKDKPGRRSRVPQAESVEVMRRRARHRLIGAAVLVGIGVVGFPMLFDTQPRPIPADIPIDIPDRSKVTPLSVPAASAGAAPAPVAVPGASMPVAMAAASKAVAPASPAPTGILEGEEVVPSKPSAKASAAAASASAGVASREPGKATVPPAVPADSSRRSDDGQRARALLEGRSSESSPGGASPMAEEARFVVQVGAFGDADKVREVRAKLERAGLKTYTHAIDTKDGKRIRVRVGPFANKAEAERAAARVKALDLQASVLTL